MKINKKATSIAEAMVLMMIIVTWVTWMYKIYNSSLNLERWTNNKVVATNIAREWIEAVTNIRNTNWIIYWSDTKNCWNTFNYNNNCIWDTWLWTDISAWSYTISKNSNDRWYLTSEATWNYNNATYRNTFRVWLDSNWFYTQSWIVTNITPLFTREIIISYPEDTTVPANWIDSNDEKMQVRSLVQWQDNTSNTTRKVELIQTLTNWKK